MTSVLHSCKKNVSKLRKKYQNNENSVYRNNYNDNMSELIAMKKKFSKLICPVKAIHQNNNNLYISTCNC